MVGTLGLVLAAKRRGLIPSARAVVEALIDSGMYLSDDAGRLPFDDGTFDVVTSTEAFHWFPDRDAVLREAYRVLFHLTLYEIRMTSLMTSWGAGAC